METKRNTDIKLEIENVFVDIEEKKGYYKVELSPTSYLCNYKNVFHAVYEIMFHLYILMLFEILFYICFITKVEKEEIIKLIIEFSHYIRKSIQDNVEHVVIYNYLQYIRSNSMPFCDGIKDNYQSKKNISLRDTCFLFIYINTIIFFTMNVLHYCIYRSFRKIMSTFFKIVIFLVFCGCFEYLFFVMIISKYKIITKEESLCIFLSNVN